MNSSRSCPATEAQFVALVEHMEAEPEIARGFKKTANARINTQRFWEDVAIKLNDLGGATKDKKKWMKYWTDRKTNIKKKAAERAAARRRTGGGLEQVRVLTNIEERVLQILGGEGFAVGDSHLRYPVNQQSSGLTSVTQSTTSPSILRPQTNRNTQQQQQQDTTLPQGGDGVIPFAFYGFEPASPPSESPAPEEVGVEGIPFQISQSPRQVPPALASTSSQPHISTNAFGDQGPSRQPPSQRRSQMTSLAESFLRLEEKRLALDEKQAETNRIAALAWRDMAAASQLAVDLLKEFVNKS